MSSAEFAEWQAYRALESFEPYRADLRAGIIADSVARALSGAKTCPGNFMPDFERGVIGLPEREQTMEEMQAVFYGWKSANDAARNG